MSWSLNFVHFLPSFNFNPDVPTADWLKKTFIPPVHDVEHHVRQNHNVNLYKPARHSVCWVPMNGGHPARFSSMASSRAGLAPVAPARLPMVPETTPQEQRPSQWQTWKHIWLSILLDMTHSSLMSVLPICGLPLLATAPLDPDATIESPVPASMATRTSTIPWLPWLDVFQWLPWLHHWWPCSGFQGNQNFHYSMAPGFLVTSMAPPLTALFWLPRQPELLWLWQLPWLLCFYNGFSGLHASSGSSGLHGSCCFQPGVQLKTFTMVLLVTIVVQTWPRLFFR